MVETINCPSQDSLQLITEHARENFLCASEYLGIPHSDELIVIQIILNEGRRVDLKNALYRAIAEGLHEAVGVATQDVSTNLAEVGKEHGSFGAGIARYAGDRS